MQKEDTWRPFAQGRTPQTYLPGQLIYLQGTEATRFYYVISGRVKCFMSSETGDERTLTIHRSGDLMGESSFFDSQPRVSSAVAVTKCEIVSIDRAQLEAVFASYPSLAFSMLQYLARTVRLLSVHVDDLSFLGADRRLARCLIGLRRETDGPVLRCTHEELGFSAGVSRVTVSRVLGSFAKKGWLRTGYGSITIVNQSALSRFAEQ